MSSIFTKKSLIVSAALILAIICTGVVAASAHTGPPIKQKNVVSPSQEGIPAIPPPRGNGGLLSVLDVVNYLGNRGFVGGPTRGGSPLGVQNLHLTTSGELNDLEHIFIPGVPRNEKVYYSQLKGPFVLSPRLSQPTLNTFLPGGNNVPALRTLLPDVGQTLGLNNLGNSGLLRPLLGSNPPSSVNNGNQTGQGTIPNGVQPALNNTPKGNNTLKGNQLSSGKLSRGIQSKPGKLPAIAPKSLGKLPATTSQSRLGNILQNVYEIFDAHTGNLLAWGPVSV